MTPPVEIVNLVKDYDRLRALAGVSLRLEAGEVFGLVGPNRSGKTTLIKLLLSLSQATSGQVFRFGAPAHDRRTLGRVGYVHENQAFPRYLSARQLLHYYGALSFLPEPVVRARTGELLALVGLADRDREPIARFSKGMVQRLGLAQALLNEPDLLVLDEPAEGLDVLGLDLVRDVVLAAKRRGGTVLFVSHNVQEVERLCDRVGVLRGGRLVFTGPLAHVPMSAATGPALAERLKALFLPALEDDAAPPSSVPAPVTSQPTKTPTKSPTEVSSLA